MDDDEGFIGMMFNLLIGGIALTIEITVWLFVGVCVAIVSIFNLFFEDGPSK